MAQRPGKNPKTNIWEWNDPNDLVPAGTAPRPEPQTTVTLAHAADMFSDAGKRAREKQRIIDHSKEIAAKEKEIVELKSTITSLKADAAEAELEVASWKNIAELFRDGHSDSEAFSEACETYDRLTA